jgi:hypothetical protein
MKKYLAVWSKITKRKLSEIDPPDGSKLYIDKSILPFELNRWVLRECDRKDYIDWMPLRMVKSRDLKIYYVNVNKSSDDYKHTLVMTLHGWTQPMLSLWDGSILLATVPAAVDRVGEPPDPDKLVDMATYLSSLGHKSE